MKRYKSNYTIILRKAKYSPKTEFCNSKNNSHFSYSKKMKYIIQFSHSYFQFRIPELNSLLELNELHQKDCYDSSSFIHLFNLLSLAYIEDCPFLAIDLPSDDVASAVDY